MVKESLLAVSCNYKVKMQKLCIDHILNLRKNYRSLCQTNSNLNVFIFILKIIHMEKSTEITCNGMNNTTKTTITVIVAH